MVPTSLLPVKKCFALSIGEAYYLGMDAELKEYLQRMEERMSGAFVANLGDLRTELVNRIDGLDRRLEAVEKRIAHLGLQFGSFAAQFQQLYNDHQQTLATQYAQQVAIDQLAARVKRLEEDRGKAA